MVAKSIVLLSYIQIRLIIKTAYLLEAFKPHLKIFEFKIVEVKISLTKAGSTRHESGTFLLSHSELVILYYWRK